MPGNEAIQVAYGQVFHGSFISFIQHERPGPEVFCDNIKLVVAFHFIYFLEAIGTTNPVTSLIS